MHRKYGALHQPLVKLSKLKLEVVTEIFLAMIMTGCCHQSLLVIAEYWYELEKWSRGKSMTTLQLENLCATLE